MATNTGGGTTASFSNTPQAVNDTFAFSANISGIQILDVMANDLGGVAKSLWSVDNGISSNVYVSPNGNYAPSDLLAKDTVFTTDAQGDALSTDKSLHGAKIWIDSAGKIGYDASSLDPT